MSCPECPHCRITMRERGLGRLLSRDARETVSFLGEVAAAAPRVVWRGARWTARTALAFLGDELRARARA